MTRRIKKFFAQVALLSVELIIAWSLFFLSLLVFVYVAFRIFYFKKEAFDHAVIESLRPLVSDTMNHIMVAITFLGTHEFLIPANLALITYFLFIKKHKWYSIKVPVVALGGVLLMFFLKFLFNRPRPLIPLLEEAKGLSFPSGHALMSVSFYGLLIHLIWLNLKKPLWLRWSMVVFLVLLILTIGFSRVYLIVHYASDVIAGFAMGVIWLSLSIWVIRRLENYSRKEIEPELHAG